MNRIRLLRTTAFRLALLYAGVFSVLSSVALGFVYWSTAAHIEARTDMSLRSQMDALLTLFEGQGLSALRQTIRQHSVDDVREGLHYQLRDGDGELVAGDLDTWPARLEVSHEPTTAALGQLVREQRSSPGEQERVRVLTASLPDNYRLMVGHSLHIEESILENAFGVISSTIFTTVLVAVLGGALIGYGVLRRIDSISRTAGEIMAGDLSRRLPVRKRDDEFDELARKLNSMLDRIEQLMTAMREVSDNIAHDLRTPLNRLHSRLEVALLHAEDESEYRAVIEQAIADADGLFKTFNALLSIAHAEAGSRRNDWSTIDLGALVADVTELYDAVAEQHGIELEMKVAEGVHVQGNRRLLAQAVGNLLDNAVKYTSAGGRVRLNVMQGHGASTITVSDAGRGIPQCEREHVLERFVRLDDARSTAGNGLGLSLVRAVAQLHGATLRLDDNRPGLRVTLQFTALKA